MGPIGVFDSVRGNLAFMAQTSATAPGKIILFGEHAVVYGRPAIAVPLAQVRASALVEDGWNSGVRLYAPDIGRDYWLREAKERDPLAQAVRVVVQAAQISSLPNLKVTVRSTIPIASGLGSGAAMAAAVIRSLAKHLAYSELATDSKVSELTYQVETLLHGTPSGIDNTVVSYEKPVFFIRQQPRNKIETFSVSHPLLFLVADTGIVSKTKDVVGDVRRRWQEEPAKYEQLFDHCGRIASAARDYIEDGKVNEIGRLMVDNQRYLQEMTVSSPELEQLIQVAMSNGALGAKLSGAGRGGNMIALVDEGQENDIKEALLSAGAKHVLTSVLAS